MDPGEWDASNFMLSAWQPSTEVLRTNRESGVHNGVDFFFDVKISSASDTVTLQLMLNGNFIGSDMWHSVKGNGFDHPWYSDGNFYQQNFTFAGKDMTIKYRSEFTGGYDDVVYAFHENEPYPMDSAELLRKEVLNVMSYNIYCLTPPIAFTDQDERCRHIVDVCEGYDVVLIQEAFDNDSRTNELIPNMSPEFPYYTAILDTANTLEDGGIMIFSRWPIETELQYYWKNCESQDCLANKGIMYAKINKLGVPYHIMATHMQAFTSTPEVIARMAQLHEAKDFIQSLGIPANEPVIYGGDLNVDKHVNNLNEYDSLYVILNSFEPALTGYPNTYDPTINYYGSGPVEYLDYVLAINNYATPVSITNEPMVERSIHDDLWGMFDLSDHFAIRARIEYPANVGVAENRFQISTYPNPTNGTILLSRNLDLLEVYSLSGSLLMSGTNTNQADLTELPAGTYILRAFDENTSGATLVIKQ